MNQPSQPRPAPLRPDFDPRAVPVLGTDAHLPAVPLERLRPDALEQRFAAPPIWTPEHMPERNVFGRPPADAAVLVPIVMRGAWQDRPTVLLTERTSHLSTHSGQVAFPGGRVDEGDASAAATALREAHEEVGLEPRFAKVIGQMPVYVTGTAFHVTPVVALVDPGFELNPNPHEVETAFEVPLDFLMNPANHRRQELARGSDRRVWFSMPYSVDGREHFIWGATAGMLRNLYRFLAA